MIKVLQFIDLKDIPKLFLCYLKWINSKTTPSIIFIKPLWAQALIYLSEVRA